MANGSLDDIFIEIEVRVQQLEQRMRRAEEVVDSSVSRMDKTTGRVGEGFEGISKNIQRAVATLAGLHVALLTTRSLTEIGRAGFRLMVADVEDVREATEGFLAALEKIPVLGSALGAGRGIGELIFGTEGLQQAQSVQELDFLLTRALAKADRAVISLDKASARFDENEKRIEFATQIAAITERQGKLAERELAILKGVTQEERIRLKFAFEREDLERKIAELNKAAGRLGPRLGGVFKGKIEDFEQTLADLIDAREQAALRKLRRSDPTESFVTALGIATFGTGAFNPLAQLDPPTKSGQEEEIQETKRISVRIDNLIDLVDGIGFQ